MSKLTSTALFVVCSATVQSAHAAHFYLTDTADSFQEGDGKCSLREAVETANYNDCWTECGCGDSASYDIIHLNGSTTYTLQAALDVWDSAIIVGAGQSVIRAADNGSPFSGIVAWSDAWEIELTSFTLSNFRRPALLVNDNSWVYANSLIVRDNNFLVGSWQNSSIMTQPGSYLQLNSLTSINNKGNIKGGGLYVGTSAVVDLNNSYIALNTASQYSGGVHVQGTLNCSGSLITSNSANLRGGGVTITSTGTAALSTCTVTGNTAPQNPNIW